MLPPLPPGVEAIDAPDQAHWLQLRTHDVTSTESAALFGLSPYLTEFELYHRKLSGEVPAFTASERMLWGNRLEAAIAAGIAEERGWQIAPFKSYLRDARARIGSSFDFVILGPNGPAHLEIKNVDAMAFRDGWLIDDDHIEAPEHIEMQVQHQMLVSGFSRAYIGALIGGNRAVVIERERDEQVIAAIRYRIAAFWSDVDARREPSPVMPRDAEAVIRRHQYAEPGKILDASHDDELAQLVREYRAACAERDRHDELATVARARLLERIGDAERVLLGEYTIAASVVADVPPMVITPEMVGQTYGGRRGHRAMRVTPRKAQAARA